MKSAQQTLSRRLICPLCERKIRNPIEHYRIDHDIDDVAKFNSMMQAIQSTKERRARFSEFVEDLKVKKTQGKITAEDYREAIMKWV